MDTVNGGFAGESRLVLCCYPRLRDNTNHTTAAMIAIMTMAMISLPIVSLCTIASTLAHHADAYKAYSFLSRCFIRGTSMYKSNCEAAQCLVWPTSFWPFRPIYY